MRTRSAWALRAPRSSVGCFLLSLLAWLCAGPAFAADPPAAESQQPPAPVPTDFNIPLAELPSREEESGWFAPCWRGRVFPHFRLAGYYDDNIFIQHTNREGDYVGIASAGIRAGWGEVPKPVSETRQERGVPLKYEDILPVEGAFLMADYTGSRAMFMHHPSQDSNDQDALARVFWTDSKLTLGALVRYQALTASEIEAGSRVRQNIFKGAVTAQYAVTGKSTFEIDVSDTKTHYQGITTASNWLDENWWNWQVAPKTNIGMGLTLGLLEIENYPEQKFERPLFRIRYQPTEKISFNGRIGTELRQLGGNAGTITNLVCQFGVDYKPFDGTSIAMSVYRDVSGSAILGGEIDKRTGVNLVLLQRFLQKLYLTVTLGYDQIYYTQYYNENPGTEDGFFYGKLGLAMDISRWANVMVFYGYQDYNASEASSSFYDNQVGFEVNVTY